MPNLENWGDVKCTLDSKGTLIINTEKLKDVVIDATSSNTNYKVPWTDNRVDVKSVIIKGHISFKEGSNLSWLFYNLYNCESFNGLENLDVSEVTNMEGMFHMDNYNQVLKTLDLSNWKTSNVTDMNRMFTRCSGLTSLDLSGFDTSNVINTNSMFYGCYGLISLDLSNFNTSKVDNTNFMFNYCNSLTSIITPKEFDTNDKSITQLYGLCNNWCDIYGNELISKNNVKPNMLYTKTKNNNLKWYDKANDSCYFSLIDNVLNIYSVDGHTIGYNASDLRNQLSDIPNITKVNIMGPTITFKNSDGSINPANLSNLFYNCSTLSELNLNHFDTSNVTNMKCMFQHCSKLTSLNISILIHLM